MSSPWARLQHDALWDEVWEENVPLHRERTRVSLQLPQGFSMGIAQLWAMASQLWVTCIASV